MAESPRLHRTLAPIRTTHRSHHPAANPRTPGSPVTDDGKYGHRTLTWPSTPMAKHVRRIHMLVRHQGTARPYRRLLIAPHRHCAVVCRDLAYAPLSGSPRLDFRAPTPFNPCHVHRE